MLISNETLEELKKGLKPCPFCGNTEIGFYSDGSCQYWGVYCDECGGGFRYCHPDTPEEVARRWNERVSERKRVKKTLDEINGRLVRLERITYTNAGV